MVCVKALYKLQLQLEEELLPTCSCGHIPCISFHHFPPLQTFRLGFLKVSSDLISNAYRIYKMEKMPLFGKHLVCLLCPACLQHTKML